MSKTATANLTTEAAIARARIMISRGEKLNLAADTLTTSRGTEQRRAAELMKDARLLDYRLVTMPDALEPVLEALIRAASGDTSSN